MSTSGGSSGGGVTFAKQTAETPYGDPGLYALTSTVPVDGGWLNFDLSSASAVMIAGAQTDDTWQAAIYGGTVQAMISTYSDGTDVGSTELVSRPNGSRLTIHAEVAQALPIISLLDETGFQLWKVSTNTPNVMAAQFGVAPGDALAHIQTNPSLVLMDTGSRLGVGYTQISSSAVGSRIEVGAEDAQTTPVFVAFQSDGTTKILEVTGDAKVGFFNAAAVARAAFIDPTTITAEQIGNLLITYGLMAPS